VADAVKVLPALTEAFARRLTSPEPAI
jgi:hypothetical protein